MKINVATAFMTCCSCILIQSYPASAANLRGGPTESFEQEYYTDAHHEISELRILNNNKKFRSKMKEKTRQKRVAIKKQAARKREQDRQKKVGKQKQAAKFEEKARQKRVANKKQAARKREQDRQKRAGNRKQKKKKLFK